MLFRQRRSRSELNASQTAPSVLESPRASIDHMSVQFPDISKMKSTLDGESGTRKVEPDIQFFSLDMTQFLSSLVVQIKKLYKLLENFKSSVQEIAVTATDQSSLPSDDASERAIKGVGSNNSVDLTKGSDALLHTDQFWIDPSEDFVQHNHTGDHVKNTLSGEELKAFLALCKACEADLHLFFEKVGEAILNFYLDDESSSRLEAVLVLATKLLSKLQEAANFTGACVDEQVESQFQERSRQSSSKQPSKHTRVWFQMPDGDFTLLWVDPSEEFLKHTHSGQVFDDTSLVKKLEVEHGDAKIGGKNKKQSRQAQAKKDVQAREEARAQQQPQTSIEEESIHEIFSRDGRIPKDWTLKKGFVIGPVLDQMKDEICWAIVLVRLLQAIYNIGRPINQQVEFSIDELVDQIKPGEEKNLQLSNLNLAFNHIRTQGVMKKPTTKKGSRRLEHWDAELREPLNCAKMLMLLLFKKS